MYMYILSSVPVYLYAHAHTHVRIYMYIHVHVHIHCMYVYMYVHTLMQDVSVDELLGHQFVQRRMQKPSSCSACEEIIWQDGLACQSEFVYIYTCTMYIPCS